MKKLTVTIEGVEAVCNFGINYFYKHFFEQTGIDMLVEGLNGINTTKMFDIIPALYYAAYSAECSSKKVDPVLTYEQFEYHVMNQDEKGAAKLLTDYTSLLKPVQEGEQVAQTETP